MVDTNDPPQPRDNKGHFATNKAKSAGSVNILSHLIHTGEGHDDTTLIDVKVTNPLRRIVEAIGDLKKHQSTTFSLRFTIPLIALPVFLLVAFQLGRVQTACNQAITSKVGTIKNVTVQIPKENTTWFSWIWTFFPTLPKLGTTEQLITEERTVLINPQNETLTILHHATLNLKPYENQQVLITGKFSACSSVITLESKENIFPF